MDMPTFLRLRQAAPWMGLLIVMSILTYGLNLLATATAPTASAVFLTQTAIDHVQDNSALLDDAALELGDSQVDVAARSSPKRVVTITGRDAMTGERQQVQCTIDADRVASDALMVDLKDFCDVVWGLCE